MKLRELPDEVREGIAENQRASILDIAERLEAGETLPPFDAHFAAGVLRGAAERVTSKAGQGVGRPPDFPHGEVALEIAMAERTGTGKNAKIAELIERYEVSETAIKDAWRKHRDEARAFIKGLGGK